jgi:hypothetical protein
MQSGPPNVHGLVCARCGSPLELPADLNVFHCTCPYCGLNNPFPEYIAEARRQQLLEIRRQEAEARAQAERARSRAESARSLRAIFVVLGIFVFLGIGAFAALYVSTGRRFDDPAQNGEKALRDELAKLQKSGCGRILVAPRKHSPGDKAEISLYDLNREGPCAHLIGATSSADKLKLRASYGTLRATPAPASTINYRLCADETSPKAFVFETERFDLFWVAAIECPRSPGEGAGKP